MMKNICFPAHDVCTGCGVCEKICPSNSIHFEKDDFDCQYPVIDLSCCIQCGSCMQHCHVLGEVEKNIPQVVYAAWNTCDHERKTSASGGIASAIYHFALSHNIYTYGVHYEINKTAKYIAIRCSDDIAACKNSKYVCSECIGVFPDIKKQLISGERVIFIGLPCHVSALKKYLGKRYDNLLLVDIICHGVAPVDYLNQHIKTIEKSKRRIAESLSFRDPEHGTEKFYMTLKDKAGEFYCAIPKGGDGYSTGYHTALTYRENCYNCKYASQDRVSDITIGDFSGLGRVAPWEGSKIGVSCILVSTSKGRKLIDLLIKESLIICKERPIEEATQVEIQLSHPSLPHKNREFFKQRYALDHDFEKATRELLRNDVVGFRVEVAKKCLRKTASKVVPKKVRTVFRSLINKMR